MRAKPTCTVYSQLYRWQQFTHLDACVTDAAKLGLAAKGKGGFLQRAFSGRKAARSDYEEQQMLLGLKAVEKMKQMVLVRQPAAPWRNCSGCTT